MLSSVVFNFLLFANLYNAQRGAQKTREQVDWDVFEDELTRLEKMGSYDVFKNEAGFTDKQIQKYKLYDACATRVSLALTRAGAPITSGCFNPAGTRVITSVHRLHEYITSTYGNPDTSWSGRGIANYRHPSGAAASNHISGGTGTVSKILYYSPPEGASVSYWSF